jgi:hypothetical protein
MQNAQGTGTAPPGDGGVAGEAKENIGGVVTGAKQAVGQMAESLKARAVSAADEKKGTAAETLGTVADALRGAAHDLGEKEVGSLGTYAESAAEQLDKVARYLREKDFQGLTRDTETFARRHPEVFLGGAFLAGMLAARFLKSSRPRTAEGAGGASEYQAGFNGGYGGAASSGTFAGGEQTSPFNPPHFASETSGAE